MQLLSWSLMIRVKLMVDFIFNNNDIIMHASNEGNVVTIANVVVVHEGNGNGTCGGGGMIMV
jgi:hypothetical protein